jgi:hypothetical protein
MGQSNLPPVDSFFGLPGWLIMLVFLVVLLAACETGYRLGMKSRLDEKTKAVIPTIAAAVLGVLGLLLAFTMSMSVTRFETRRQLVLDEANAIGTDYWRAQLMPAPERTELQDLLREYAAVRLRYAEVGINPKRLEQARQETAQLQGQLWARASAFAEKDPRSVTAGLLLQSLNNTFDLENARWTAFLAHVPQSVVYVNGLMGLLAMFLVGYGFGLAGHRHALSAALLIVSVTAVLGVIIDLDRPRSGIIRVSQQPMIELQRQLAAPGH